MSPQGATGDLYAWGETAVKESAKYEKAWANYAFMQAGQSDLYHITKYTFPDGLTSGIWYDDAGGFIGDNGDGMAHKTLASCNYEDDVARTKASGVWHTPTDKEWAALLDSDHFTWNRTAYSRKSIGANMCSERRQVSHSWPVPGDS